MEASESRHDDEYDDDKNNEPSFIEGLYQLYILSNPQNNSTS